MLPQYIQQLVDQHLNGDISRFDELWDQVPSFVENLRKVIASQDSWVYLQPQTFDGWYLVQHGPHYDLYYQERGVNCWEIERFEDERLAVKALLKYSTDLWD